MRDELFLLGRILFSLVFLRFGVAHLTQTEGSAQYATYKGVPRGEANWFSSRAWRCCSPG